MPQTYTPIATYTSTGSVSDYTFSSIPQTYTDLVLIVSATNNTYSSSSGEIRFNGDTGSNYSATELVGSSSGAQSFRLTNQSQMQCYRTAITNKGIAIINVMNYANSTTYKSVVSRANIEGNVNAYAGLWRSTAAITSITFKPEAGTNFTAGSMFTLYGILKA